ncbi:MAG: nucleotidyltransferase family protein [Synechococcus sp.]
MNARLIAYDFITGCLAAETPSENDTAIRSAVGSEHLDWKDVIEIANEQLVTPALWVALRDRGLARSLPSDVCDYFCELHQLNTLRNQHLRAQTVEIARQLNAIYIVPLLLKGTASLFTSTFADPGCRIMADVDIQVRPMDAQKCWNALQALGYRPVDDRSKDEPGDLPPIDYGQHHHLRPLYRPGSYGAVEIHRNALPAGMQKLLPMEYIWKTAHSVEVSGVSMRVPTPTCRLLHNVLHSAIVDRAYARGEMPLRSLHELALMQTRHRECLDWTAIHQLMEDRHHSNVLKVWLYLSHRLFGNPLPISAEPNLRIAAHYMRVRLQARWGWTEEVVERAMWFSVDDICRRFGCANDGVSVTKARGRLAAKLFAKCMGKLGSGLIGGCERVRLRLTDRLHNPR